MVSLRHQRALALALALAFVAPSLPAQSRGDEPRAAPSRQELDEAQRRYKRGLELFNEGQYDASMIEFRKANELAPSYKILYNIGQVNRQLNDYARAVESFERYLREGGSNIAAARVAEVQRELEKLRQRVAKLEITSNVAGAEVLVDDLSVGRTPFAQPLLVNAGRRKLTAIAEGHPTVTRAVEVAGAESVRTSLDFGAQVDPTRAAEPVAAPTTAPTAPSARGAPVSQGAPAASDGGPAEGRVPWVAWGMTGAFAVGAGVTGVLALRAKDRYQEQKDSFGADPVSIDDRYQRAQTFGIITDVLIGATLVTGGVSLYLTLAGGEKAPDASARAGGPSWRLGVGPGYVGANGMFLVFGPRRRRPRPKCGVSQ